MAGMARGISICSLFLYLPIPQALVLGFRLYFTKDSTTINTAGATVRQLVNVVYDRVNMEDSIPSQGIFSSHIFRSVHCNPCHSINLLTTPTAGTSCTAILIRDVQK